MLPAAFLTGRTDGLTHRVVPPLKKYPVLILVYTMYPSLSANTFSTFNCGTVVHADGETRFLRADYSIECDSSSHRSAEAYAWFCIVFICIGTPLVYLGLLWRNREAVQSGARSARHLLFLVEEYRSECWYWESVETTKKLLLTGFAVFIAPGTVLQLALALGLALAYGLLLAHLEPYLHQHDNLFAGLLNMVTAMVLFFAILLEMDTAYTQLEGATSDPGLAFQLQGYGRDTLAVALVMLVCVVFALFGWLVRADMIAAQSDERMRYSDGSLAWFPKLKNLHAFFSHSQQDAGDQIAHIKKELEKHCSTIEIFTDVAAGRKEQGLDAKGSLEDIVNSTGLMVCFMSKTYFTRQVRRGASAAAASAAAAAAASIACSSLLCANHHCRPCRTVRQWCILELKMALEAGKLVVFVWDSDSRHGGMAVPEVLEYALGQMARAAKDAASKASNVVNMCTRRLSPRQCAAERAVATALVASGAVRSATATEREEVWGALQRAKAERDEATVQAKSIVQEQGGTPPAWTITEGELLVEFLQVVLPTMLDADHPNARPVIPWYRDAHTKKFSLKRMVQETLTATFDSSHFDHVDRDSKGLPVLHIAGETSRTSVHLPAPARRNESDKASACQPCAAHLYLSPHHAASAVLQQKLQDRLPGIICSTEDLSQCSHMLMVLDAGARGDAQADSPALNNEAYRRDLLAAMECGVRPVLLHVGSVPFDTYMWLKGTVLWEAGVFGAIAVPCPESVLQSTATHDELEAIALARVGLKIQHSTSVMQQERSRLQVLRALRKLAATAAASARGRRSKQQVATPAFRAAGIKAVSNPIFKAAVDRVVQAGAAHDDRRVRAATDLSSATSAHLKELYNAATVNPIDAAGANASAGDWTAFKDQDGAVQTTRNPLDGALTGERVGNAAGDGMEAVL